MTIKRLKDGCKGRAASLVLATFLLCLCLAAFYFSRLNDNRDFAIAGNVLVKIPRGAHTEEIGRILHQAGLVKDGGAFKLTVKLHGYEGRLQAGIYQLPGGLNNRQLAQRLTTGQIALAKFALPEGYDLRKAAAKLEAEGLGRGEAFLQAAKDYAPYPYMQGGEEVLYKAEGFIFPATYEFPVGASEESILRRMVEQFDIELQAAELPRLCQEQGLRVRDMVNIAAMVELEATLAEEQPLIAGIFRKRLALGMPIQSDTTVQYALGGRQREIITFADTQVDSPYNTYTHLGLPPGPIAAPGLSAMLAVVRAQDTDYLYFVAEPNWRHRFSRTYQEHLQAIRDIDAGR